MQPENLYRVAKAAELELTRRRALRSTLFYTRWAFRKIKGEKFIVNSHHEVICDVLDRVFRGELTRVIINVAPRYTKTDLAVKKFMAKGLAHNPKAKFIHLSYSDDLALDNSDEVRENVKSDAYQELFPHVKIKKSTDSKKKWYTEDGGGVYATSAQGQVTGFGAGQVEGIENDDDDLKSWIDELDREAAEEAKPDGAAWVDPCRLFGGAIIIDDPIKPEDAESEQIRNKVNNRFNTTIRSRVNSRKTPIIIIMQRLHPDDLVGYLQKHEPGVWTVISLPSIKEDGTALWPEKHTLAELRELERLDKLTFDRQHMQNAYSRQGLLYKPFREYGVLPDEDAKSRQHTDVADTGDDYLCTIGYKMINGLAYVQDVVYTQERAEETEEAVAEMNIRLGTELARFESNNGGRYFRRNVEAMVRKRKSYSTRFDDFPQRQNKETRILSNASKVNNFFIFPIGWQNLWPAFYKAVTEFMAVGKNLHDDAPDCMTSIYEHETYRSKVGYKKKN